MTTQLHQVSLREQSLAVIRQGIVTGELVPGEIYSAASLAANLGVSNSPVREAMLTLVEQGVMETVRNRGFRLVPLSDMDRRNILDLRLMLEVPAMGRIAEEALAEPHRKRFEEVASLIVDAVDAQDMLQFLEQDRTFHLGLLGLLGNSRLNSIVEMLRDQTRLLGIRDLSGAGELRASALEHAEILSALLSGDGQAAEQLMRRHLGHIEAEWAGPSAESS